MRFGARLPLEKWSNMENVKEIIAKNLVALRKSRKLTQQELAEKLNYSDKAVSRWEHAETLPDIETLCKLCDIYGVKFEYLLQEEQPPADKNPYVIHTDVGNRIAITLISLCVVWLIATVAFAYLKVFMQQTAWQIFIWAIPISGVVGQCCNRMWGNRIVSSVLLSATMWTTILGLYVMLIAYRPWMFFIVGVPIQIIIVLVFNLKKPKA